MIEFRSTAKYDQPATIIFLTQDQVKSRQFSGISASQIKNELAGLVNADKFSGESKQILPLILKNKTVLFVGLGEEKQLSLTQLRVIVRHALLSPFLKKATGIEVISACHKDLQIVAVIEGILIGGYSWKKYRSQEPADTKKKIYLIAEKKNVFLEAITICNGVTLARDLVNDNADLITAEYFEKIIRGITKAKKNLSFEILNRKQLKSKGLNLHLAVNQASAKEPKLIIIKYKGDASSRDYTAIIGKGLTFDTGGLNLKPTGSIETMRCDMSGAAAVVATLQNVLALKIKKNVIFAVAMAENAIGSRAYKPGDVFRGYSGKTVEIMNTDAEGRLVLADAIAYVAKNYKPDRIIDIATLTGACVIALGHDHTGLVSSNDALAERLLAAAKETDDRAWRLPMYPELKDAVKSQIADIKNTGFPKGAAGTITGAEFLRQFTNDLPWAHLDIAGTSFMEGQGKSYYSYGGTGAGVRLLTKYLQNP